MKKEASRFWAAGQRRLPVRSCTQKSYLLYLPWKENNTQNGVSKVVNLIASTSPLWWLQSCSLRWIISAPIRSKKNTKVSLSSVCQSAKATVVIEGRLLGPYSGLSQFTRTGGGWIYWPRLASDSVPSSCTWRWEIRFVLVCCCQLRDDCSDFQGPRSFNERSDERPRLV